MTFLEYIPLGDQVFLRTNEDYGGPGTEQNPGKPIKEFWQEIRLASSDEILSSMEARSQLVERDAPSENNCRYPFGPGSNRENYKQKARIAELELLLEKADQDLAHAELAAALKDTYCAYCEVLLREETESDLENSHDDLPVLKRKELETMTDRTIPCGACNKKFKCDLDLKNHQRHTPCGMIERIRENPAKYGFALLGEDKKLIKKTSEAPARHSWFIPMGGKMKSVDFDTKHRAERIEMAEIDYKRKVALHSIWVGFMKFAAGAATVSWIGSHLV